MSDLPAERAQLAADLAAVGVRVATDPAAAQAPCVLVGPVTRVERDGVCAYSCEVPVWLIAPAPGNQQAVDWLGARITTVMDALGAAVDSATLGSYNIGQGDLPAYEITATLVVKE